MKHLRTRLSRTLQNSIHVLCCIFLCRRGIFLRSPSPERFCVDSWSLPQSLLVGAFLARRLTAHFGGIMAEQRTKQNRLRHCYINHLLLHVLHAEKLECYYSIFGWCATIKANHPRIIRPVLKAFFTRQFNSAHRSALVRLFPFPCCSARIWLT
jgi:hypothetical protein